MIRRLPLVLIAIIFGFCGCTLAPKYERPKAPVSEKWPEGAAYKDIQIPAGAEKASELGWMGFFTDPNLQKIIKTALESNRDLRVAALNIEKARALYGIQRGELFPSFNTIGSASAQRIPADLSSTGDSRTSEQYSVNFGITSWEIDFFGRIRSLKDRALEEYLATDQAHLSARILLISAVAQAYLTLCADRENLKIAKMTFEAQKEGYTLIKRRYEIGLASELDLYRSQTQVDSAQGDIARLTQVVAQDENALRLLMGISAEALPVAEDLGEIIPPRDISAGMSSDVLLSRPDIVAAEHRLKAANANIGAARAALFPRISLTTTVGTASSELSGLFGSGSGTWSFAPQIIAPIFDARLWAAYDATKVERELSVALYEKAIQAAFREVSDSLAVKGTVEKQLYCQKSLVDALEKTYRLSILRYEKGIDSYLGVLDAQRSLYSAQQGLVAIKLARLANQVKFYAVLGGGVRDSSEASAK
ncbi:MAG: efflux transporter outer membrane subunit [Desulfobacteraceae bacterium]|nr:MAG: efflux transporter outer membrane subunit [Desulfobacteraceae bacterium]